VRDLLQNLISFVRGKLDRIVVGGRTKMIYRRYQPLDLLPTKGVPGQFVGAIAIPSPILSSSLITH